MYYDAVRLSGIDNDWAAITVTTEVLKLFMDHSILLNSEKDTTLYLQNM